MSTNNFLLTEADEALLTTNELKRHADYSGDADTRLLMRAMARKLLVAENPKLVAKLAVDWLDSPIKELRASARIMNVLVNADYRTIRDVYEEGSERLMRRDNFGARCRSELEDIFKDHGFIWRASPIDAPYEVLHPREAIEPRVGAPTISIDLALMVDLVNAAHHNLAHYERQYGRFASRGKQKPEHDRLKALVTAAEDVLKNAGVE